MTVADAEKEKVRTGIEEKEDGNKKIKHQSGGWTERRLKEISDLFSKRSLRRRPVKVLTRITNPAENFFRVEQPKMRPCIKDKTDERSGTV